MYKHSCYPFDLSLVAARADHVFSETRTHPTPLGAYDDTAGAVRRLVVSYASAGVPSPSSALGPLAGGRYATPGGRSPPNPGASGYARHEGPHEWFTRATEAALGSSSPTTTTSSLLSPEGSAAYLRDTPRGSRCYA